MKLKAFKIFKKKPLVFKILFIMVCFLLVIILNYTFANFHTEKAYDLINAFVPEIPQNKIIYDANGGSECLESTYVPGEPLGELCNTSLNNHIFLGWFDRNGNRYNSNTIINENSVLNLTASWLTSKFDYTCVRAKSLQHETCNAATGLGCLTNYSQGDNIYYGNIGNGPVINAGDAFDCDVNEDGFYDPENERFYYVSELLENTDYGVLLAANSYADGAVINNNNNGSYYGDSATQTKGPLNIYKRLPDNIEWSAVRLSNSVRDIKNDQGVVRKAAFDYSVITDAARYLTYQEIANGCGFSPNETNNEFYNTCNFLLQHTTYANASAFKRGYWLETAYATNTTSIWYIDGNYGRIYHTAANSSTFGSRPVVEIPKNKIRTINETNVTVKYMTNGGSECADKTVSLNSNVGTLCTPTKNGYIFTGWVDRDGNEVNSDYQVEITPILSLYATYSANYTCRRAASLHTEICASASGYGCKVNNAANDVISYGNLGSGNTINTGDAFDCDVNGDGIFDSDTERFYYVNDLDSDSNYGVLIYYSNVKAGVANQNQTYAYYSSGTVTSGPLTGYTYLPTAAQWPNVTLSNPVRDIKNSLDVVKKAGFNYSVKTTSARLLTYQEIIASCGITPNETVGELDTNKCRFLLEKTQFATSASTKQGYWLETVYSTGSNVWTIDGKSRRGYHNGASSTTYNGIRPVIEVPKSKILLDDYYSVVYNDSIGKGCTNDLFKNNTAYGKVCTPYSDKYEFLGWYDSDNNEVTESTIFNINNGLTLTAHWQLGCTENTITTYEYSGNITPITINCSGIYSVEAYGAQGGTGSDTYIVDSSSVTKTNPGKFGDKESALFYFAKGDIIYATIGGKGYEGVTNYGESAGIGKGGYNSGMPSNGRGGGGGATHISTVSELWTSNNDNMIICAQGGRGGSSGGLGGGISYYRSSFNGNDTLFGRNTTLVQEGNGKLIMIYLGQ